MKGHFHDLSLLLSFIQSSLRLCFKFTKKKKTRFAVVLMNFFKAEAVIFLNYYFLI